MSDETDTYGKLIARIKKKPDLDNPTSEIYHALHCVGDDPLKSDIAYALEAALTTKQFQLVAKIFKFITEEE